MPAWVTLLLAIIFEVTGTVAMKLSMGFTRLVPSVAIFVFYTGAFVCLTLVLKQMSVGVTYAVWAGLGTALIAVVGVLYFGEPVTPVKVISLVLIIVGVAGLNISGGH